MNLKLLIPAGVLIILLYGISILAVMFDLFSGVKKAKARGEYRSSRKLRLTVEKLVKYFNMLAVLTCIDAVQLLCILIMTAQSESTYFMLPWFTAVGVIFVCFIELKSIFEKNSDKQKADIQEAAKVLSEILTDNTKLEMLNTLINKVKTKSSTDD